MESHQNYQMICMYLASSMLFLFSVESCMYVLCVLLITYQWFSRIRLYFPRSSQRSNSVLFYCFVYGAIHTVGLYCQHDSDNTVSAGLPRIDFALLSSGKIISVWQAGLHPGLLGWASRLFQVRSITCRRILGRSERSW
ncbi:hypothetical protein BZA77DRAFT_13463 [Pyronema omphalodes]|nr:hypothetical protein BZA77DRAFT_13463 [Pyronema omphalodes]